MFDYPLIDCLLLRALPRVEKYPVVFACCASEHIREVRPVLKALGYTLRIIAGQSEISYKDNNEPDAIEIPNL